MNSAVLLAFIRYLRSEFEECKTVEEVLKKLDEVERRVETQAIEDVMKQIHVKL